MEMGQLIARNCWPLASRAALLAATLSSGALTSSSIVLAADPRADSGDSTLEVFDVRPEWQAFYFGVNAGMVGLWRESRLEAVPNAAVFGLFAPLSATELGSLSSRVGSSFGGIAGGQVGFTFPVGRFVTGAELDFNLASTLDQSSSSKVVTTFFSGGLPAGLSIPAPFRYTVTTSHEVAWAATARARLGYLATERMLVYVTGGLAFGEVRTKVAARLMPAAALLPSQIFADYSSNLSRTRMGPTFGGGLEYAMTDRISIKTEYLYLDLGSGSGRIGADRTGGFLLPRPGKAPGAGPAPVGGGLPAPVAPGASLTMRDNSQFQTLRIGLNYRF